MEQRIRRLGIAIVALFALVFAQLAYVQVFAADDIKNHPANFSRQLIAEYDIERGKILTADGMILARSVPAPEGSRYRFVRRYPQGDLFGYVTGYYSRIYGRTALERSMNDYLSGEAPELAISTFTDLFLGREKRGGSVIVTIDPALQQAARDALVPNEGAVVAIDPRTGDILALHATPGFDPNLLSSGTDAQIRDAWRQLNDDPEKPLLGLSHQELFLPGSSFKIVTASAALEDGFGPDSVWPNPHRLQLPLTNEELQNFGDDHCNGGSSQITLAEAFEESCNVTFAEIGLELGAEKMAAQAREYGLCATFPPERTTCEEQLIRFDLGFANGRFPEPAYFERNDPLLAFSAIGLDNDLVNPLSMALIASAVANDGVLMRPRIVTQVRDAQGRVAREVAPERFGDAISAASARALTDMMIAVVNEGTGFRAQLPGIQVAGKTGTATNGEGRPPNAWFTAFAPAGSQPAPEIAVSVIVLDGGDLGSEATGGQVAAPIAASVIQAYLR
ncbi:MAG TPA: penicillin-binding transpeptidase domain-containing protein [Actinomycetota bacterium]|nr:penicillin-binding transpeptidase domain-containing protein [Actinomycetota bacterium]